MKNLFYIIFILIMGTAYGQVKKKPVPEAAKPYVNPVKLTREERLRPYMDEVLKSRDSLSPKEAERRRQNIEKANPFKKYGFYPKIATLSKGKYLEAHDLDSIIIIGSVKFNRKTREIVEFRKIDLSDPDAQPYLDTAGRWFSPDPLSEEFSNWSPYNFAFNNPLKFKDPDGRAPEDATECCWWMRIMPLFEESSIKPNLIETLTKTGEIGTKTGEASARQERFNLGRYVEKEELAKMGREKNTKTFEFTDPKTGKTGRTIPDAMTEEGGTIEIKHVVRQPLTKQLRGQIEISKANGQEAILKLNEAAETTKPLRDSGIKIQRYTPPARPKIDNTKVIPGPAPKLLPVAKPKNPCGGIPNCA